MRIVGEQNSYKRFAKFTKMVLLYASTATMIITWIGAYFNDKQILVTINSAGEAQLELFMIGVMLLVLLISFIKDLKHETI